MSAAETTLEETMTQAVEELCGILGDEVDQAAW
jgi:hypothetical protein